MGLHLNLYHEITKEKLVKARDPLKLSMIALGVIAACFAGYYFVQLGIMRGIKQEYAHKQAEFAQLDPLAQAAVKREEELVASHKISGLLVNRIEGRFYWAPVLEQITQKVPRTIQVTRIAGEVAGDNKRCTLTVDGIASGDSARNSAEEMRTALTQSFTANFKEVSSSFRTLEDGAEPAHFDGKQWPTATFSMFFQFAAAEEAPSAPLPARKKR